MGGFGLAARQLERDSELAERLAELMTDLLNGVLGDLQLTEEQQAVASEAVPRRLRQLRETVARGCGE